MTHSPHHSGGVPGMSGPPGKNYPVSKPSPAPPGEKGGGGYVAPSEPKQSVKSLITSDKAYKVDTPKKETKKFDDSSREKGLMYSQTIGSKKLGKHRKEQVKRILYTSGGNRKKISKRIKEKNLQGAVDSLMKGIPKEKFNIKKDSLTRLAMKKLGVPINYSTFAYDAFIGTETPLNPKFGLLYSFFSSSDAKKRKINYKPLTLNDFSNNELVSLKFQAKDAILKHVRETGHLSKNTQIQFRVGGTRGLNKTLGTVSAYVDDDNNIRMLDTYDFGDKTTTYGILLEKQDGTITKFKPKNYAQFISATLLATAQGNVPPLSDLVRATAVLESSEDVTYPKKNTEKRKLEEQTGQKIMMDLNLGQIQ